jgi:hypothetical protein
MNRSVRSLCLAVVVAALFASGAQSQWLQGTTGTANENNVKATGNVGIGEWPYTFPFNVQKGYNVFGTLYLSGAFGAPSGQQGVWIGYDTAGTPAENTGVIGSSNSNSALAFHTGLVSASSERMRINAAGNVGIGTSAPADILHLQRDQNALTSTYIRNATAGATAGSRFVAQADTGAISIESLSSTYTNGGARQPSAAALISSSANGLSVATTSATSGVRIYTGGNGTANERLRVDAAGTVLIGTTASNPNVKLDVSGGVHVNGDLALDNGAIRANQHLGFLKWESATGLWVNGYLRLMTPISDQVSNMFTLHVYGYNYNGSQAIDIRCSAYSYAGLGLTSKACTTTGTQYPVEITTEPSGGSNHVVVRIGDLTTPWYFPNFTVDYDGWVPQSAAGFVWSVQSAVPSGAPALTNMNNVVIRPDGGGSVEIGQNPGSGPVDQTPRLTVHGSVVVDGDIGAKYRDVAEWVSVRTKMSPGTVVIVSADNSDEVVPSDRAYDTAVAGVVSGQPGITLGVASESKAKIATTGRVTVHADATRHPIKRGDLLVTSDKPGMAMYSEPIEVAGTKMHRPGTLVGKALEPLESGEGDILVLLSLQ